MSELEAFRDAAPSLGGLVTEGFHSATSQLSELAQVGSTELKPDETAQRGVASALRLLQDADVAALEALTQAEPLGCIVQLTRAIQSCLLSKGRVFMTGCGASGRLAVSLDIFGTSGYLGPTWELTSKSTANARKLFGFMAGGDVAFIRAVEKFEDEPSYGARQLKGEGFANGDLLIAFSAAGAAPYVVGACKEALALGGRVAFVYCNPDDVLDRVSPRTKELFAMPNVCKVNVNVGCMAVSGSTRMQAATGQLLAAGLALQMSGKGDQTDDDVRNGVLKELGKLSGLIKDTKHVDYGLLAPITIEETWCYQNGDLATYTTDPELSATTLTDLTERAPTFSLTPFESRDAPASARSTVYMCLDGDASVTGPLTAWQSLLRRDPKPLDWSDEPEVATKAGSGAYKQYDLSLQAFERRQGDQKQHRCHVSGCGWNGIPKLTWLKPDGSRLEASCMTTEAEAASVHDPLGPFLRNALAKMVLNAHSTCVQTRRGRVQGNVMIYARASNHKLVDRVARYVLHLWGLQVEKELPPPMYEDAVKEIFLLRPSIPSQDSIVLAVLDSCLKKTKESGAPKKRSGAPKYTADLLRWHVKRFDELSPKEIYHILRIRNAVFIIEQNCSYLDSDGLDFDALHVVAYPKEEEQPPEGAEPVAYMRCLKPGVVFPERAFGRVIVTESCRGGDVGRELVQRGIKALRSHWTAVEGQEEPEAPIKINAQVYLVKYYERHFGFKTQGEPYDEDGIMHIAMTLGNCETDSGTSHAQIDAAPAEGQGPRPRLMVKDVEWQVKEFSEMSSVQVYNMMRVRCDVFCVGQQFIVQDVDLRDWSALHILAYNRGDLAVPEADRLPVAYMRCLQPGVASVERAFGRVLVEASCRGGDIGRELIKRGIDALRSPGGWVQEKESSGPKPIRINAQAYLASYYEKHFAFKVQGEPANYHGVKHVAMLLQ